MAKVHRFDIAPYDSTLYFITSRKRYVKVRERYTEDGIDMNDCDGMSSDFQAGSVQLIGVFNGTVGTLAHELAHAIFKVLESRGIPTDSRTSEAFCYLMSHWMDRLHPLLK